MKKVIVVLSVILLLSAPVFASSGSNDNGGFFDSFIGLFVPDENYFENKIEELNNRVNQKLGGLGYLYKTIESFFKNLNAAPSSEVDITLPNSFSSGKPIKVNLFGMGSSFLPIARGAITCFMLLITAVVCYKKLITLFEK